MRGKEIEINGAKYMVYPNGDIYGKQSKIKYRKNSDGYLTGTFGRKGMRTRKTIHRIVAECFVPNPCNYPEVDHLDANRMKPCADNLEWVTHEENIKRAIGRGNYKGRITGEKNPKAKLNEEMVLLIRQEYDSGITIRSIHRKYNIPESTVGNIVHRHTWTHI